MRTTRSVMVRFLLTLAVALALLTTNAEAQLVFDGETNILVGVTTNLWPANLIIGNSGSFTTLGITGGSVVENLRSYIGNSIGANSNTVFVSGANSRWTNDTLNIGVNGEFNQLIVSNGGAVNCSIASFVGGDQGRNNSVVVTGANSKWITKYGLTNGSDFNRYTVANGGMVSTLNTIIYGSSNAISVSGVGSVWTGFGALGRFLQGGGDGSFNQLVISNGGSVFGVGQFGQAVIGDSGSNNSVIVTGAGSLWSNAVLTVGGSQGGSGNRLLISNGATVFAATNLTVGAIVKSGTLLRNDNAFLTVTNSTGSALLSVNNGLLSLNGGTNNLDHLRLSGTFSVLEFNSGTLQTRRLSNNNGRAFVAGNGTNLATLVLGGTNGHFFANGLLIQTNATLTGTGTLNGSVTNCGTIFLTNADQLIFTGPVVNKGVIIAVTGAPRFGSTFTNLGTLITTASINVANVSVSGPDIVLQFNSVSNYLHEVQASTNVSSGLWQSLTNGLLGTGSPITFTDPGGALSPNRTYRALLH